MNIQVYAQLGFSCVLVFSRRCNNTILGIKFSVLALVVAYCILYLTFYNYIFYMYYLCICMPARMARSLVFTSYDCVTMYVCMYNICEGARAYP